MLTCELEGSFDITIGELLWYPYVVDTTQHDTPINTSMIAATYLIKTNDKFREDLDNVCQSLH